MVTFALENPLKLRSKGSEPKVCVFILRQQYVHVDVSVKCVQ